MKKIKIILMLMLFSTLAFSNTNSNNISAINELENQVVNNCVTNQEVFNYLTARGFHPVSITWNSEGNAEVGTSDAWAPVVIVLVQNCTIVGHTMPPIE